MPYNDKQKQREYQKIWYQTHKKQHNKRTKDSRNKNRKYIEEIKLKSKCAYCDESHPACLDFHHLNNDEKVACVSRAATRFSLERVKEEIEKCIIVCSNCHRKLHYK